MSCKTPETLDDVLVMLICWLLAYKGGICRHGESLGVMQGYRNGGYCIRLRGGRRMLLFLHSQSETRRARVEEGLYTINNRAL